MTIRSNLITQEEMAAINGPVAREDGTLICVNNMDSGWQYSIEKPNFEVVKGNVHQTSQQARNELISRLPAHEQEIWKRPHNDLAAGTPWFGQRVGDVSVSTEAVFARAAYTQNNTLTQQSLPRIQRPNAYDVAGNSLANFAARAGNVTYLQEFLKQKTVKIVKRNNIVDNSPAHFAATSGNDTVQKIITLNSQSFPVMSKNKFGNSALDLLNEKQKLEVLPKLVQSPLLKTRVVIPQQDSPTPQRQQQQDKSKKIER